MKTSTVRLTSTIAAFALAIVTRVSAFDEWEHESLGNIALRANIAGWKAKALLPENRAKSESIKSAVETLELLAFDSSGREKNVGVSYGLIVRLVDFMPDNFELLRRDNGRSGLPEKVQKSTVRYLQTLATDKVSLAYASHQNQNHFQERTLYSFWFWHKAATTAAAEGNLWGALLLNAYADHFLQDSFAPGHLIAPRDANSHDLYSLLIHDSVNNSGMTYVVKEPKMLAEPIKMLLAAEWESYETAPIDPRVPNPKVRIDTAKLKGWSSDEAPVQISVKCYGDGILHRHREQAALIAVYGTRSISDLLESYVSKKAYSSFDSYQFDVRFALGRLQQLEFIDFEQSFGKLTCIEKGAERWEAAARVRGMDGVVKQTPVVDDPAPIKASLVEASAKNPALAFSLGLQNLTDNVGNHARFLLEGETLIAGERWDYLRKDFPEIKRPKWFGQWGLTAGVSIATNTNSKALGGGTRLVMPIPALNLQLSANAGARHYAGIGVSKWADFETIRGEWGMHVANFFLGVGHDHYPENQRLKHAFVIEAGINYATPVSRIGGRFVRELEDWFSTRRSPDVSDK